MTGPRKTELTFSESHPNLFRQICVWIVQLLVFSAVFFLAHNNGSSLNPTIQFFTRDVFGAAFLILALMLAYGMSDGVKRFRWARIALTLLVGIQTAVAVSYWIAMLLGLMPYYSFGIFWTAWALSTFIWSQEPVFNPLSSVITRTK